jgi:integrase
VRPLFGNRETRVIYVEPSDAPTDKLRKEEKQARLASAKLRHKELCHKVEKLPDEVKAHIIAAGGDVLKLMDRVATIEARLPAHLQLAEALALSNRSWIKDEVKRVDEEVTIRAATFQALQAEQDERRELENLRPIALFAETAHEFTFQSLFEHWRGPADNPRIRQPRHYAATAKQLELCFPKRDYRSITEPEAWKFADWLNETTVGPAAQGNHIANARSMYDRARRFMIGKPNPFKEVEPVAQHHKQNGGKFTYEQLRAILAMVEAHRWGDNRMEKRHAEALWIITLGMYTGARVSEIAALRKDDLQPYRGVGGAVAFYWLHFRPEIVKAEKGEDKSRQTPLHPAIAAAFVKFVEGVKGPLIFAGFNGKSSWIVSNFPSFLRDNADALGIKLWDRKPVDDKGRPLKQHSLRHTFHTAMNDSRLSETAQRVLMGRKSADVHAGVYATDMALEEQYKDVVQLRPLG